MNNGYVEKLVKKKTSPHTMLIHVLSILIALMIILVINVYFGIVYGALVAAACIYLVYYIIANTSVEYEFVLVKNELSIEAIYGRSRRKLLHTFDVSKCEVIAPVDSTYVAGYHRNTQMKMFDFTSGEGEEPVYILIVPYGAETAKLYMEFN